MYVCIKLLWLFFMHGSLRILELYEVRLLTAIRVFIYFPAFQWRWKLPIGHFFVDFSFCYLLYLTFSILRNANKRRQLSSQEARVNYV